MTPSPSSQSTPLRVYAVLRRAGGTLVALYSNEVDAQRYVENVGRISGSDLYVKAEEVYG